MKKILVIEDETAINELICMNLEIAGYESVSFFDGEELSCHLKNSGQNYNLAILDIMLPGKDGFSLLAELKEKNIPVICLTAMGDLNSKVKGLKDGAEDYMVKPFEMLELLVRIDKVLSRHKNTQEKSQICIRDVVVDEERRMVFKSGEPIFYFHWRRFFLFV